MKHGKEKFKFSMEILLMAILAVQTLLIAVSNLTLIDQNVDYDTGKMFCHIMAMCKERTLWIPGWSYSTTLEYDCTTLFALPLYFLTKNIFLASGLSNILLFGLFTGCVFYLFDGKNAAYPLLAMNLIAVPYAIGMLDYYNMMFFGGSQYVIKVMIPILLTGIFVHLDRYDKMNANAAFIDKLLRNLRYAQRDAQRYDKTSASEPEQAKPVQGEQRMPITGAACDILSPRQRKQLYAAEAVFAFLLLLTSVSSGIYVAVCGLVPLICVYAFRKLFLWKKVRLAEILLLLIAGICVLSGVYINGRIMGGARGQGMVFISAYQTLANFSSCFVGIFELFGGATTEMELAILSAKGIGVLAKVLFVIMLLICGCITGVKCLKRKGDLLSLLLLSMPIWNYFILNVTNTRAGSATYEYRYHLIGGIPLVILTAKVLLEGLEKWNKGQRRYLAVCGLLVIGLLNLVSFRELFARGEQNADLKELCEYCKKLDVEAVYLYDGGGDSDICRGLDDSVPYVCLMEDGYTWNCDYYGKYVDAPMQTEDVIIAVDNRGYDWGDRYDFVGHWVVRFDTVAGRSLYYFE